MSHNIRAFVKGYHRRVVNWKCSIEKLVEDKYKWEIARCRTEQKSRSFKSRSLWLAIDKNQQQSWRTRSCTITNVTHKRTRIDNKL